MLILKDSGYDLLEARNIIIRMAQKSERDDRSTFFDTHPTGPERLARFNEVYKEILKDN